VRGRENCSIGQIVNLNISIWCALAFQISSVFASDLEKCKKALAETTESVGNPEGVTASQAAYALALRVASVHSFLFQHVFHYRSGSISTNEYLKQQREMDRLKSEGLDKIKAYGGAGTQALLKIALSPNESLDTRRAAFSLYDLCDKKEAGFSSNANARLFEMVEGALEEVKHILKLRSNDPEIFSPPKELPSGTPREVKGWIDGTYDDSEKLALSGIEALTRIDFKNLKEVDAIEKLIALTYELEGAENYVRHIQGTIVEKILESGEDGANFIASWTKDRLNHHDIAGAAKLLDRLISKAGDKKFAAVYTTANLIYEKRESEIRLKFREGSYNYDEELTTRFQMAKFLGYLDANTMSDRSKTSAPAQLKKLISKKEGLLSPEDWFFCQIYSEAMAISAKEKPLDPESVSTLYGTVHRLAAEAKTLPSFGASGPDSEFARPETIYRVLNWTITSLIAIGPEASRRDPILMEIAHDDHFGLMCNHNAIRLLDLSKKR